jgi:hypothetical protein
VLAAEFPSELTVLVAEIGNKSSLPLAAKTRHIVTTVAKYYTNRLVARDQENQ